MAVKLREFGSYTVGGSIVKSDRGERRPVRFSRDSGYVHDPRGHYSVGHVYVQYFIPEDRRPGPPFVLVHGGGMHGSAWETTPDGRPGWVNLLVGRGYEVHVLDNVERGRSGFAPLHFEGDPIIRTMEETWDLYRLGEAADFATRRPFANQKFPVEALEALARSTVPRWLSTTALQIDGLASVLERLGRAVLVCHSQGGQIAFDATERHPRRVAGIIGVEPSTLARDLARIRDIPVVILQGDFLDRQDRWITRRAEWHAFVDSLTATGGRACLIDTVAEIAPGGSHNLMMDRHNAECLDHALHALERLAAAAPA
ncbi:alpha/beta fold hydrolase [Paracoccus sp. (in: a-proteobacteria)]|uniref:alpha/beta fold hydrolase n=1 Tax=Paracoccus sp. TaxID=267 RepID=UPI003A8C2846